MNVNTSKVYKAVGFTGTREGMSKEQLKKLFEFFKSHCIKEFHHGCCIGADAQAHELAYMCRIYLDFIIIHPPINTKYKAVIKAIDTDVTVLPPKPYLERNHDIVDACDILIACPKTKEEELRSGTWATIRYARKKGKEVIIL